MAASRSEALIASEAEDLVFRHRTLISAQRILEAELHVALGPLHRDDLTVQRLRRLKVYLRNSIVALEKRMEAVGVAITDDTGSPRTLSPRPTKEYAPGIPPYGPALPGD
ncbi:MAG: hypothetical protein IH626_18785 [Rhodospirillales bacterium]|nr:hypothetical protein [Rhodospirillales bacterium]